MKNIYYSGLLFLGALTAVTAQVNTGAGGAASVLPNSPTTNTNVGIGTNNPTEKLEVIGNVKANRFITNGSLPDGTTFIDANDKSARCKPLLDVGSLVSTGAGYRMLKFVDWPASNIDPKSRFWFTIDDRSDNRRFAMYSETGGWGQLEVNNKNQENVFRVNENGDFAFMEMPKTDSHFVIGGAQTYPIAHTLWVKSGTSKFEGDVFMNTNLGIGTTNFVDGANTYRLSVKGKIRADEVKVYNTWADYVFAKEYELKPLTEVERYIDANGHLPNVPSAKEVTEKGLELGEMAKIQQEKIEELTLYLIQQNKQIEELKAQVKTLLEKK